MNREEFRKLLVTDRVTALTWLAETEFSYIEWEGDVEALFCDIRLGVTQLGAYSHNDRTILEVADELDPWEDDDENEANKETD